MLFNSLDFLIFLPIVFVLYWSIHTRNCSAQNVIVLAASYVFYGWWDWRFLSLIAFSTIADYVIGIKLHESANDKVRNRLLWTSIGVNLGLLGFFKYFNFFIDSWIEAWATFGYELDPWTLQIILPVGISFYTFQTMSYSLDIHKRKLEPTKDLVAFAAFVSFFPQLVAGPIERAVNFMPQILNPRRFNATQGIEGLRLIIWGLFKKIVIADTLAPVVHQIFSNYEHLPGLTLIIGVIFFCFQIYCDFSGYSDIAIGTGKLFGFELTSNFKFPFFSRNIAEFWRRWHVSLSTWLNDYLFFPLAIKFRYWGKHGLFLAIVLTFAISGLWHGAGWNFVIYGVIHGFYFLPTVYGKKLSSISSRTVDSEVFKKKMPSLVDVYHMAVTFAMFGFSLIFFRSPDVASSFKFIGHIFTLGLPDIVDPQTLKNGLIYLLYLAGFVVVEWMLRHNERRVFDLKFKHADYIVFPVLVFLTIIHIRPNAANAFIYFQF